MLEQNQDRKFNKFADFVLNVFLKQDHLITHWKLALLLVQFQKTFAKKSFFPVFTNSIILNEKKNSLKLHQKTSKNIREYRKGKGMKGLRHVTPHSI